MPGPPQQVTKSVNVSVVLCTYNRCKSLESALDSLAASNLPAYVEWEVLVVDNNSNDETKSVAAEYCRRYQGRFHYLFEPRQGKSYALNAGVRTARGDVLAFTDDDAIVEPTWLANLTDPLSSGDWAGSGGRTFPSVAFSRPEWLSGDNPLQWGGILGGLFDMGAEPCELIVAPYGVNMAFRKKMFEKYGVFREELGPRPGSEIRNEDTEFGQRLMAARERLYYVPSAVVYHEISTDRLRKEYFLKWWFDFGRARVREAGNRSKVFGIPRQYLSIPNNVLRVLPLQFFRWVLAINRQKRFHYKCLAWAAAGRTVEIWRQSSQKREPAS